MDSKNITRNGILKEHKEEYDFLQLIPANTSKTTVPATKSECHHGIELQTRFAQAVCASLEEDLSSLLFSPHALIDALHHKFCINYACPNETDIYVFHEMIINFGFHFFETCDTLQLPKQLSFKDIFLNRTELFRMPEKDISFAIDFAIGLGVAGKHQSFFHGAVSYFSTLKPKLHADSPLYARHFQRVKDTYTQVGNAVGMTDNKLQDMVREHLRKAAYETESKYHHDDIQKLEQHLYEHMTVQYSREISHKQISSHGYRGISCLDDLLHCVAHIYAETILRRNLYQQITNDRQYSKEQIALITPDNLQIHVPCENDNLLIDSLQENISKKREETISLSVRSQKLTKGHLQHSDKIFSNEDQTFRLTEWASPSCDFTEKQLQSFMNIVYGFWSACHKSYDFAKTLSKEKAAVLLSFATNENLFELSVFDVKCPSLAPLVLYSMLHI